MVPTTLLKGDVVVVNGDAALLRSGTVRALVDRHRESGAKVTISSVNDPLRRDGRILRDDAGEFLRIVEDREASADDRLVSEINVGLYCFRAEDLPGALAGLKPENRAGEIYLTDAVTRLRPVAILEIADADEGLGINDRVELSRAEGVLRRRVLEALMLSGVTVRDPASTWVAPGVEVGPDTVIEPFTLIRPGSRIGAGCRIGPHADIGECEIGDECRVEHSWLRGVKMGDRTDCGPFVRIRPGTVIAADVHVGSFAEINRTRIGRGSRVPHLSYLGDAVVGENVNIGAGTITANYDGKAKNPTTIEDGAFVGVATMLRAPVKLGKRSRTGAGSVVLQDVPDGVTVVGSPAKELRRKG
jgi:bifunctional UDP-N-acetylglucosamine pyrophosphorylase/glucosamine-1-phosphate N-acetyltransferase